MRFEIVRRHYKGRLRYRVRLVASNNRVICWTELYNSLQSAREAIDLIKASDIVPVAIKGFNPKG
jgi:uncharacterized protein YegP (UPF0339 family)